MTGRRRATGRGRRAALAALVVSGSLLATTVLAACGSDGDGDGDGATATVPQSGTGTPSTGLADDPGGPTGPAASTDPTVAAVVAATVNEPIVLAARPGDDGYVWVAERAGRIRRLSLVDAGRELKSTGDDLLDISDETTVEAERGLLGMTFSPDGDQLFISYTNEDGNGWNRSFRHRCDASGGQSGSPVYLNYNNQGWGVTGVHVNSLCGTTATDGAAVNCAAITFEHR